MYDMHDFYEKFFVTCMSENIVNQIEVFPRGWHLNQKEVV
jgi:hypothetical protein